MSDTTMTDAAASQEEIVSATTTATTKIRELQVKEGLEDKGLRVRVVGGGCHGFSYALGFDDRKDGDTVQSIDGVDFLVDKFSAPYLKRIPIALPDLTTKSGRLAHQRVVDAVRRATEATVRLNHVTSEAERERAHRQVVAAQPFSVLLSTRSRFAAGVE